MSSLSDRCKEVILGSLLGDGSLRIHRPYRNARFSFRHSVRQKDYFFWKVKEMAEISSRNCFWIQKPDGWGRKEKLRYQSLALESLTEFYHLTHLRKNLNISKRWLKTLTPLSLAVWWMDDGSIVANGRKGVFATDGFSYRGQLALSSYLKEAWKVRTGIGIRRGPDKKECYRLYIYSTEELKKLLRIILPHISVPGMLPKVILLYKDPQLQQRWISEVCQLTEFSPQLIEKYLAEKKLKWKNFRE